MDENTSAPSGAPHHRRRALATLDVYVQRLQIREIARIDPVAAALEILAPSGYLVRELARLKPRAAEILALMAPILVTRHKREFRRLAGHRTYAVVSTLLGPEATIPVLVIQGRVTNELGEELGKFGIFSLPLLSNLDASAVHQLDSVAAALYAGYRQPGRGRPARGQRPATPPGIDVVEGSMTPARLAQLTGRAPSTLGRDPNRQRSGR